MGYDMYRSYRSPILIINDFNIHANVANNADDVRVVRLIRTSSASTIILKNQLTRRETRDLAKTKDDVFVNDVVVGGCISDDAVVTIQFQLDKPSIKFAADLVQSPIDRPLKLRLGSANNTFSWVH